MKRSRLFTNISFAFVVLTIVISRTQAQTTINVPCDTTAFVAAINTANGTPAMDTLNLAAGCMYSFTVGDSVNSDSALPRITTPMTINGSAATIQRAGGSPAFRLLYVASGANLTLDDVTVTGGGGITSGGGIYNDVGGALTLTNSTLSGNSAGYGGGIYNDGTATVTNSTLSGSSATNGGGLYNNGGATLTVTGSTLSGNNASQSGGGIVSGGIVNVINSTLSGNSASNGGGILSNNAGTLTVTGSTLTGNSTGALGAGGGINSGGTLIVIDSTLSSNSATYGGGIYMDGTATVTSSTLSGNSAGNGGAIYNNGGATLTATNCIISGNYANIDGGGIVSGGVLTLTSSTLSGNGAGVKGGGVYSNGGGTLTVTNSIVWGNNTQIQSDGTTTVNYSDVQSGFTGTGNLNVDPLFVNPIPFSSPTTAGDYHLQSTSPVINVGSNAALPADAHDLDGDSNTAEPIPYDRDGDARIYEGTVDMGADEQPDPCLAFVSPYSVAAGDEADLIFAIQCANANPDASVINLAFSTYSIIVGDSINPDSALPRITTPITINGNGATLERASGSPAFRLLYVASGANLTLDDVTVTGGGGITSGGGIYNDVGGTLTLTNSTLSGNSAGYGGGIYNDGTATVTNSTLSGSSATNGGGLYNNGGAMLTVTGSTLSGNNASQSGGGIVSGGILHVTNSILSGNSASNGGGILSNNAGTLTVTGSTLTGNTTGALGAGGGINSGGTLTVTGSMFSGNSATYGGGIYMDGTATVTSSTLSGNSAGNGGAIYNNGGATLTVTNCILSGNYAITDGGGIVSGGVLTLTSSTLSGNGAGIKGGGIYSNGAGTLTMTNSIVWGNNTQIQSDGTTAVSFSNIQGGFAGTGNLNADPLFVNPIPFSSPTTAGDYHLQSDSPALNLGSNAALPLDAFDLDGDSNTAEALPLDLDGNTRVVNATVDMGAFEHQVAADVIVSETSADVTEAGSTDTYTVRLASRPAAEVTLDISSGGQAGATPNPLTFTPSNWSVEQTVTVTAVNDDVAEGAHGDTLTHSASSTDLAYDDITVAGVSVAITDNDAAAVSVEPTVAVTEGGATDTYSVVLTSQPTSDVTVTPTGDADCSVSAALVFTSGNWMTAQDVTVTAIDDAIAEGDHTCTVTNAATSSDGDYNGIPVASVEGTITDDDAFPAELLDNGGFELHTISNKLPDGWTVKNATFDKLLCKPGKPHAGLCAFSFAGSVGEKGQLSQTANLTGVTVDAGDTLTLSAFFKANDTTAKTQMHLIVTYSGNPTPVRSKITVGRNAIYTLISLPVMDVTASVEKIKVLFKHKSNMGKVLIDDVSLMHAPAGGRRADILPPPEVEGFRGGN